MKRIIRSNSENIDFIALVELLDADLAIRDGADHEFYHQFNAIDAIQHAVVAYEDDLAVACGAIKEFDTHSMEVKRMYTLPSHRGKGFASLVLKELEAWASELSYDRCLLETGLKNPEAVALYKKQGYVTIPNYGQYVGVENSFCFEKNLLNVS